MPFLISARQDDSFTKSDILGYVNERILVLQMQQICELINRLSDYVPFKYLSVD